MSDFSPKFQFHPRQPDIWTKLLGEKLTSEQIEAIRQFEDRDRQLEDAWPAASTPTPGPPGDVYALTGSNAGEEHIYVPAHGNTSIAYDFTTEEGLPTPAPTLFLVWCNLTMDSGGSVGDQINGYIQVSSGFGSNGFGSHFEVDPDYLLNGASVAGLSFGLPITIRVGNAGSSDFTGQLEMFAIPISTYLGPNTGVET